MTYVTEPTQVKSLDGRCRYLPDIRTEMIFGGTPLPEQKALLADAAKAPHIIVGTPGRIKALSEMGDLNLSKVKHFVLDECDRMLEALDMRGDVQAIFKKTPHDKQVLMFSATLSKETGVRGICKKFMQDVRPPACTLVAISAVLLPLRAAGGRLPSGHPATVHDESLYIFSLQSDNL